MTFRDETVIATGSAQGIGAQTARTFAKEGANVVIADIDETSTEETVEDLPGDGDGFAVQTDVSDEDVVDSLVLAVVAEFGGVDVLANNAGIAQEFDPTVSQDVDHWQRVLDDNLRGPYICSRAVGPYMLEQEGGTNRQRLVDSGNVGRVPADRVLPS